MGGRASKKYRYAGACSCLNYHQTPRFALPALVSTPKGVLDGQDASLTLPADLFRLSRLLNFCEWLSALRFQRKGVSGSMEPLVFDEDFVDEEMLLLCYTLVLSLARTLALTL